MYGRKVITTVGCVLLMGLLWLGGCGSPSSALTDTADPAKESEQKPVQQEFTVEKSMDIRYAENFSVDYYTGGYKLLSVCDGTKILLVPENKEVPEGIDGDTIILKKPVHNLYLVSSSVMDGFSALDALDTIRLSGQKEENWYIDTAREAMHEGKILYAGKYNKPDYELLVSEGCTLAIENMMITHSPEVVEMLQDFNIPVVVEHSSYESHPLGRVEWIKFFGALLDKEDLAEEIFAKQVDILKEVTAGEKTDKTVAFFFVTSGGLISVRQGSDYIPKMIDLAGGKYVFHDLGDPDSKRSTMNLQVEEFYDKGKDADYLIYNSSIDGGVTSLKELLDKCPVLKDFKAVQEGNVWCTTNDMYQQSMSIGYMIEDFHKMLQGQEQETMKYLFRLQ